MPGSPRDCVGHTAPSCLELHPREKHKSLASTPSPSPLARRSVSLAGVISVALRGTGKDRIWRWEDKGVGEKEKIMESESMPGEKARAEDKTGTGNRDQGRLFLSTNAPRRPKPPFCNGRSNSDEKWKTSRMCVENKVAASVAERQGTQTAVTLGEPPGFISSFPVTQ